MDNGSILRSASLTEWDSNPALDIYTETLPQRQLISMLDAQLRRRLLRHRMPQSVRGRRQANSTTMLCSFHGDSKSIAMVRDEAPPPGNAFGIDGDVPGGIPVGATGG